MNRPASPDHPIHELLASRHSPYAFDPDRAVSDADIDSLFEAARWTMSSYNAQPWRFIIGKKGSEVWQKVFDCLLEGNQGWAKNAAVLAIGLVHTTFAYNGKPNVAAEHDLGAASASLTTEATARGLCVHQMIGIDPAKVLATFTPQDDLKPLTALAIGYLGKAEHVAPEFNERTKGPRERIALADLILERG